MENNDAPEFPEPGRNWVTFEELMAERQATMDSITTIFPLEQAVAHLRSSERGEAALEHLWRMIDEQAYGFDAVAWQCVIAIAREFQEGRDPFPRMRDAMSR